MAAVFYPGTSLGPHARRDSLPPFDPRMNAEARAPGTAHSSATWYGAPVVRTAIRPKPASRGMGDSSAPFPHGRVSASREGRPRPKNPRALGIEHGSPRALGIEYGSEARLRETYGVRDGCAAVRWNPVARGPGASTVETPLPRLSRLSMFRRRMTRRRAFPTPPLLHSSTPPATKPLRAKRP